MVAEASPAATDPPESKTRASDSSDGIENPSQMWVIVALGTLYFAVINYSLFFGDPSNIEALAPYFFLGFTFGFFVIFMLRLGLAFVLFADASQIHEQYSDRWAPWRGLWMVGIILAPVVAGVFYLVKRHQRIGTP